MLTSHNSFNNIQNFRVGKYQPLLSDHCPITTTINTILLNGNSNNEIPLTALQQKFIWDENANKSFDEGLKSPVFVNKIQELMANSEIDVKSLAKEITYSLIANASQCKIKRPKKRPINKHCKPWFDKECHIIKKYIRTNGNLLKKLPDNNTIRENVYSLKRNLKKMVSQKNSNTKNPLYTT